MLIAGVVAFSWLYLKTKWTDIELREQTLSEQAKTIAGYLDLGTNNSVVLKLPPRLAEAYSSPESEHRYAVRDESGQVLFESGTAISALPRFSHDYEKHYNYNPKDADALRVFGAALRVNVGNKTLFVQVEQETHDPDYLKLAVLDEFITDGGWLDIPFLLALLTISVLIVKRALAPVMRISALAETIGPTNPSVRLPLEQIPIEILPLVRSMNAALDRFEEGMQRQREFNSNAAHQLRTPLAVLLANVDNIKDATAAEKLRTDVDYMSRIVSQLLFVSRLETLPINDTEIINLTDIVADIARDFAALALESNKSIELANQEKPVLVRSNSFAIRAALGNLIENAIKHTPPNTSVRLRVTDQPSIQVVDSGPGVPIELRTKIFERFWSSDKNNTGVGLGLAIVGRIMKALQGSVSVDDAPDGGAMFTLIFPQLPIAN
jgi:signal transduction histidine kinase